MDKGNRWAMLCKLMVHPHSDAGWVWERKLDGDRMKVEICNNGQVILTARSGADKTIQFPELQLVAVHGSLPLTLDGEVISAQGLPFSEFNQRRMNRQKDIDSFAQEMPALFVPFDVLELRGDDTQWMPLKERRKRLVDVVAPNRFMRTNDQFDDGIGLFEKAKEHGWEGVVGKQLGQAYLPHRRAWVKVKVWLPPSEYFVIGFTAGTGKREGQFGALMLGTRDEVHERYDYVCDVGTGLTDAELLRLDGLRRAMPVYKGLEFGHLIVDAFGMGPLLRVMVKAVEKTNDGKLKFPVYCGQVKEG